MGKKWRMLKNYTAYMEIESEAEHLMETNQLKQNNRTSELEDRRDCLTPLLNMGNRPGKVWWSPQVTCLVSGWPRTRILVFCYIVGSLSTTSVVSSCFQSNPHTLKWWLGHGWWRRYRQPERGQALEKLSPQLQHKQLYYLLCICTLWVLPKILFVKG